jgi:4-hydroxy-tetrahydrodipicolinate reductase
LAGFFFTLLVGRKRMDVILVGYGKMGRSLEKILRERGHRIVATVGNPHLPAHRSYPSGAAEQQAPRQHAEQVDPEPLGSPTFLGLDSYFQEFRDPASADIALEFSAPSAAPENVISLLERGIPTLCGTTGWDPGNAATLAETSGTPFLHAANFSLGMAVTKQLVRMAAQLFGPFDEFQPAIVERHHRAKLDRPSGTAKVLASTIEAASGHRGIEIASLRHGAVPGEHMVMFDGEAECVEIVHRARSREIFSRGAVAAGEWLATERPRGPVTLDDFLERICPWSLA